MSNYINFNKPQSNGSYHGSFTDARLSNFAFKNKMTEGRSRPSDIPRTESQTILNIMNSGSTDSCSSLSSELNHKAKNLSLYGGQEDRTKFVLVLYCGGTIGMKNKNGGKMKQLNMQNDIFYLFYFSRNNEKDVIRIKLYCHMVVKVIKSVVATKEHILNVLS